MRDFAGTCTGLTLRIAQCFFFAAASIASVIFTNAFFNYTAFCYLIAAMAAQVLWSSMLACADAYVLLKKRVVHNYALVSIFVFGDWITTTLSLAAAASTACITVLYFNDLDVCSLGVQCTKYKMGIAMAFLSWRTISISANIMLWLLARGLLFLLTKIVSLGDVCV